MENYHNEKPNMPEEKDLITVSVDWDMPDGALIPYASNMVVQHTGHEFIISFFQTVPPVVIGTPEEQKAQLERMGSVKARCVARVMISPTRIAEFIDALQNNYERFRELNEEERNEAL